LIYHIYAFDGQYITVALPPYTLDFDGNLENYATYKVVQTEYNENYTYTTPYIFNKLANGLTPRFGQYPYFAGSGCTIDVNFNSYFAQPYNEFEISGISNCDSFLITNTGGTRQTFFFENCSGSTSSWTLDPSESISICMDYPNFTGSTFTICLDTIDCDNATPFPTPTPTLTPFLSPTPTPSPSATQTTPTPTPTPSSTPPVLCNVGITINVSVAGYIKYINCDGTQTYQLMSVGNHTLSACIQGSSVFPGFPFSSVATFTITSGGVSC
jgi:hypothetical protein